MRFGSSWSTVELTIEAYQFPEIEPQSEHDWDANWLVIGGKIGGRLSWSFRDPCLTTWEAREFSAWLDDVAHAEPQPAPAHDGELSFAEASKGWVEHCEQFPER